MTTVDSFQPWQLRQLNRSGIRRLKIADANSFLALPFLGLVPQRDITFYEFIFPADLSCVANFQRLETETGSSYWSTAVNFSLPHLSDELVTWSTENGNTLWIAITEDYNGQCRFFGGYQEGLTMRFAGTTGSSPTGSNPMDFAFSADQWLPYYLLPSYEDSELFPSAGFSYGFSTGFNS